MQPKTYESLEQRVIRWHIDMLAPFHPAPSLSEEAQRAYHAFASELLDALYERPTLLFPTLHEDDAHPNRFNCASYGKPKLKPQMMQIHKKLSELYATLRGLALDEGAAKAMRKPKRALFSALGLEVTEDGVSCPRHPEMTEAWRFLARQYGAEDVGFARCWFDRDFPYMERTMARFYDPEAYARLTSRLNERGYRQYPAVTRPDALDYAKSTGTEETPLGYAIHGDKLHYGLTFEYRLEARVPQHYEARLLRYAELLARFDALSPGAKRLILEHTKRCDGCRYCVQTDKTGKRPLAAMAVSGETLCPYYPGFSFARSELSERDADDLIALLDDLETMLTEGKGTRTHG